jgi:hypothetical protein
MKESPKNPPKHPNKVTGHSWSLFRRVTHKKKKDLKVVLGSLG